MTQCDLDTHVRRRFEPSFASAVDLVSVRGCTRGACVFEPTPGCCADPFVVTESVTLPRSTWYVGCRQPLFGGEKRYHTSTSGRVRTCTQVRVEMKQVGAFFFLYGLAKSV